MLLSVSQIVAGCELRGFASLDVDKVTAQTLSTSKLVKPVTR